MLGCGTVSRNSSPKIHFENVSSMKNVYKLSEPVIRYLHNQPAEGHQVESDADHQMLLEAGTCFSLYDTDDSIIFEFEVWSFCKEPVEAVYFCCETVRSLAAMIEGGSLDVLEMIL